MKTILVMFFFIGMLLSVFAQEEELFYVVSVNHTDNDFTIMRVEVIEGDEILPPPYSEGSYKIQLRDSNKNQVYAETFTPPAKGYFADTITDEGLEGTFVEQSFIYMDFYLPYNRDAREVALFDETGKEKAAMKLITPEEEVGEEIQAAKMQEVMAPFIVLLVVLVGILLWWARKRK